MFFVFRSHTTHSTCPSDSRREKGSPGQASRTEAITLPSFFWAMAYPRPSTFKGLRASSAAASRAKRSRWPDTLDYQSRRLGHGLSASVSGQRERFARLAAALDALSPLKVLGRGYAIAQKGDGSVIASVRDACPGESFSLRLSDGQVDCVVQKKEDAT